MARTLRYARLAVAVLLIGGAAAVLSAQDNFSQPPPPPAGQGTPTPLPPVPSLLPVGDGSTVQTPAPATPAPSHRAKVKIDARATAKELLPAAPKAGPAPVYLGDDLTRVPELFLDAPPGPLSSEEWGKRVAHTLLAAEHLDAAEPDGFVKALAKERHDLAGLPLLLGAAARQNRKQARAFREASVAVRQHAGKDFWPAVTADFQAKDRAAPPAPFVSQARVAALSQVARPAEQAGLVRHLAGVVNADGTRRLARLAVFSPDAKVRDDAVEALAARRERDYTGELLEAMRYPLPSVARNAAGAIVKLERKDLLPQLVELLEQADPRLPVMASGPQGRATFTPEVVRINHNRNCLLCHAPADADKAGPDVFVAEVPLPSEELSPPASGYAQRNSGLLVRLDVTYLRPDFSASLPVEDAAPRPESQRFDFVVRKRALSDEEAEELREKLTPSEEGELTPHQKAAVWALRELTGRDLEAKPRVWRKFLNLPDLPPS